MVTVDDDTWVWQHRAPELSGPVERPLFAEVSLPAHPPNISNDLPPCHIVVNSFCDLFNDGQYLECKPLNGRVLRE
jgi:hypothetical protein